MFKFIIIIFNLINATNINVDPPTGTILDNLNIQTAICKAKNLTINLNCGFKQSNVENIPNRNISGIVTLQPGTYIIHQLYLYSNIIFKGQGQQITILKLQNNAESYYLDPENYKNGQSGLLRSLREDNIEIKDMTIDMNKINQIDYFLYRYDSSYIDNDLSKGKKYMRMAHQYGRFAIYTESCNNIKIINIEGKNAQNYCLDPHGEGRSEYADFNKYGTSLLIENCYIHDNDWDGITIDKSRNVIIRNNIVNNNGRHGINIVTGSYNVEVYNNTLTNNGHYFLNYGKGCNIMGQNNQLYDVHMLNIYNNLINNGHYAGICLNSVTNSIIKNNTIYNHKNYCIRLNIQSTNYNMLYEGFIPSYNRGSPTTSNNNLIEGNICYDNIDGILIRKGLHNNIISNSIHTSKSTFGIKNIDEIQNISTNIFTLNIYSGEINILCNIVYGDTNTVPCINHPNPNTPPDPNCNYGILINNICFESNCNPTGGAGCSNNGNTPFCCSSIIKTVNFNCNNYSSPCIIQPTIYPIIGHDPLCENGIKKGIYCCETGCSQCGSIGCGSLPGICCTSQINQSWNCNDYNSPCIIQ